MPMASVRYNLGGRADATFADLFASYDYGTQSGFERLGSWIETAAVAAGR